MISKELITAYINSQFVVPSLGITILINQHNKELLDLISGKGKSSFCFITAFNPYSNKLESEENTRRNQELKETIAEYVIYDGYGQDKESLWEAELSFLVLGITKEQSIKLGKEFGQNAIVFGQIESSQLIPQLELL